MVDDWNIKKERRLAYGNKTNYEFFKDGSVERLRRKLIGDIWKTQYEAFNDKWHTVHFENLKKIINRRFEAKK